MTRTWFTADQHFGHQNVIRFCARPFADANEMDEAMVECWNAVVRPEDTVWHLGDAFYKTPQLRMRSVFQRLKGIKHLVLGNHDGPATRGLPWTSQHVRAEVAVDGTRLVLEHYALRVWPGQHRGSIHLYGHSHGRLPGTRASMDVGVDAVGFCPIDLPEIRRRLAENPEVKPEDAATMDETEGYDGP